MRRITNRIRRILIRKNRLCEKENTRKYKISIYKLYIPYKDVNGRCMVWLHWSSPEAKTKLYMNPWNAIGEIQKVTKNHSKYYKTVYIPHRVTTEDNSKIIQVF